MHIFELTSPKVSISLRFPMQKKGLSLFSQWIVQLSSLVRPGKLFSNCLTNQRFSGQLFKFLIVYKKRVYLFCSYLISCDHGQIVLDPSGSVVCASTISNCRNYFRNYHFQLQSFLYHFQLQSFLFKKLVYKLITLRFLKNQETSRAAITLRKFSLLKCL